MGSAHDPQQTHLTWVFTYGHRSDNSDQAETGLGAGRHSWLASRFHRVSRWFSGARLARAAARLGRRARSRDGSALTEPPARTARIRPAAGEEGWEHPPSPPALPRRAFPAGTTTPGPPRRHYHAGPSPPALPRRALPAGTTTPGPPRRAIPRRRGRARPATRAGRA